MLAILHFAGYVIDLSSSPPSLFLYSPFRPPSFISLDRVTMCNVIPLGFHFASGAPSRSSEGHACPARTLGGQLALPPSNTPLNAYQSHCAPLKQSVRRVQAEKGSGAGDVSE